MVVVVDPFASTRPTQHFDFVKTFLITFAIDHKNPKLDKGSLKIAMIAQNKVKRNGKLANDRMALI